MSKIAVVYTSKYGTTRKYAEWIAEEVGANLFDAYKCKGSDIDTYDVIVYGGAVHAGGIMGIKFLKKNIDRFKDKAVFCFAVGLTVDQPENQQQCREINFVKKLEGLPCRFFNGGYDPEKVRGFDKKMMNMIKKMLSSKKPDEVTEADLRLMEAIEKGVDLTERSSIADFAAELKAL